MNDTLAELIKFIKCYLDFVTNLSEVFSHLFLP